MQHQISVAREGERWVARFPFSYETKDLVKGAGFRWDPNGKVWWTDRREIAERLDPDKARASAEHDQASVDASKAVDADVSIPVPPGLSYLPYQRAGIAYMVDKPNVLLADEMGLGKTIQAIGLINADQSISRVLIVCPASLKLNWKREMRKWLARPMSVDIANGIFPTADAVVINYDILAKHRDEIDAVSWDLLIVDECHYVKNPSAKRTQQLLGKTERRTRKMLVAPIQARRRVFMTGTPIVNRPIELWPLIQSIDPQGIGSKFFPYAKRYCAAYQGSYGWDFTGASNLSELQQRLRASFMVRRLKADVLTDLPPKRRQVVVLPVDDGAQKLVEAEKAVYDCWQQALQSGSSDSAAFTELSRLRHDMGIAKVPAAVEFVRDVLETEDKLVVFAHHHDVVAALVSEFRACAVAVTGETPVSERQLLVDRFQSDPTCRLFVGSIQAAGVGLTLTSAQHVVFVELDWVPGNVTQAEDRCHRIGQTGSVLVQHLVLDGSLDMRMGEIIISKQQTIESALDSDVAPISAPEIVAYSQPEPHVKTNKEAAVASPSYDDGKDAIHTILRFLAGRCDGAFSLDGQGFNRMDASFGHSLAERDELTDKQAAAARRMILKYQRQIPPELLDRIGK